MNKHVTYSIQQAANLTGLSKQVIRKWEDRYGLVRPERLANGYRMYTQQDIRLLQEVVKLTEAGHAVSQAVRIVGVRPEGVGAGAGDGAGVGAGAIANVGAGAGVVAGAITNDGADAGASAGAITNDGVDAGAGAGVDSGTGAAGADAGAGNGAGAITNVGAGVEGGTGAAGADVGARTGNGAGAITNVGAGVVSGTGAAGAGAGADVGAIANAGASVDAGARGTDASYGLGIGAQSPYLRYIEDLTQAGYAADDAEIIRLLQKAHHLYGIEMLLEQIVVPFLARIGQLWCDRKWGECQEAMSSLAVRDFLAGLRRGMPVAPDAPLVLGSCLPHERHENPMHILLVQCMLRGYRTMMLGPAPAPEAIQSAVRLAQPRIVLLTGSTEAVLAEGGQAVRELDAFAAATPDVRFYIGGAGVRGRLQALGLHGLQEAHSLREIVQDWTRKSRTS